MRACSSLARVQGGHEGCEADGKGQDGELEVLSLITPFAQAHAGQNGLPAAARAMATLPEDGNPQARPQGTQPHLTIEEKGERMSEMHIVKEIAK